MPFGRIGDWSLSHFMEGLGGVSHLSRVSLPITTESMHALCFGFDKLPIHGALLRPKRLMITGKMAPSVS